VVSAIGSDEKRQLSVGDENPKKQTHPNPSGDCRLPKERRLMKIRPLHDRILAKRIAEQDKTAGGLFIPDTAKEKPLEALVVSVGSGKILENGQTQPLSVKAGDQVLIGKYTGSEVKLDGEEHIILREDDILAILDR
jgi:chaperonin GroES